MMQPTADTEHDAESISRRAAQSKAGRLLAIKALIIGGVPPS
jgi:hypothetical protein